MPRKTRAAARAQEEDIHVDQVAAERGVETPVPQSPGKDREPLGELTPNSVDGQSTKIIEDEEPVKKAKASKAKKGKGKKGAKKAKAVEEEETLETEQEPAQDVAQEPVIEQEPEQEPPQEPIVLEDERAAAASPASDRAAEDLAKDDNEDVLPTAPEEDETTPAPSKAVRKTKKQLAKEAREAKKNAACANDQNEKALASEVKADVTVAPPEAVVNSSPIEEPAAEPSAEEVNQQVTKSVEKQVVPQIDALLEEAAAKPLPESPVKRRLSSEDAIDAIDALQDALDEVDRALPPLDSPLSPVKPMRKAKASSTTKSKANLLKTSAPSCTPSRALRVAPTATKRSPATNKEAPAKIKTAIVPQKPTLGRSASVRTAPRSRPSTLHVAQPPKPDQKSTAPQAADYLASKRRPVSLSFPTPPPIKSTKAPTKASFQLSSDATAAKLKAAREERVKRQEASAALVEKKEVKPKTTQPTRSTAAPIVKQTAASKAREAALRGKSLEDGKENSSGERPATTLAHKRATSVAANTAAKRASIIVPKPTTAADGKLVVKKTADARPRPSSIISSHPTGSSLSSKPRPSSMNLSASTTAKSRIVSNSSVKSAVTAEEVVAQKVKAREIFNRDKAEKEAREQEKKDKEEAAKKARAAAAERGRQASREWAEKQKARLLAAKKVVAGGM